MHRTGSLIAAALLAATQLPAQQTVAERTAAQHTSSHADVMAFIDSLESRGARLHVGVLGTSPQGREIPWIIASRPLVTTPGEARRSGKPIFYIQANIHGGEVEGKEAMQRLLRDLTIGELQPLLDSVIILAVPIYNTDGNDNFGPAGRNRPGQNGPDPVGLRPNGQGFDLNRDYIKQEAPETRASLALIAEWDPDVFMDLHTSNGSYHGYALTWSPGLSPIRTPVNSWVQDTALPAIGRRIMERHGFRTFPYGNFDNQDPDSIGIKGWLTYESVPRFGTNLMGISRVSLLSEAYSNDPFARRIDVTWAFVLESLRWFTERHATMQDRIERTIAIRPDSVAVRSTFAPPRRDTVIFEVTSSAGQGSGGYARRQRSGEFRTQVMPVVDRFVPTRHEARPAAYLLDAQWSEVVERMVRQGIAVERIDAPWTGQSARFRIDSITVMRPFQGHRMVQVDGHWQEPGPDSLPAGGYLVATDQRLGTLAAFLLEPASEDGYTTWNFFDRDLRARGLHPVRRVAQMPAVPRTRVH